MREDRVLIIEDNAMNLALAEFLLKRQGYQVFSASNAEQGMVMARSTLPDIILMDIQLPGMDGMTATKVLKGHPLTQDIPVVALTAHAMPGDREKFVQAGCNGYIAKPTDTKTFTQLVDELLDGQKKLASTSG